MFSYSGVLQADPGVIRDKDQIFRLFTHESQRVFHDRLINQEDKTYFNNMISEMAQKHFSIVSFLNKTSRCIYKSADKTKKVTWDH